MGCTGSCDGKLRLLWQRTVGCDNRAPRVGYHSTELGRAKREAFSWPFLLAARAGRPWGPAPIRLASLTRVQDNYRRRSKTDGQPVQCTGRRGPG